MRLDLEVLALAEDILREESRTAKTETWAEHCENIADALADIVDLMDPDNGV